MSNYLLIQAGDNRDNKEDNKAGEDSKASREASKDGEDSKANREASKDGEDSSKGNKEGITVTTVTTASTVSTREASATDGDKATSTIR